VQGAANELAIEPLRQGKIKIDEQENRAQGKPDATAAVCVMAIKFNAMQSWASGHKKGRTKNAILLVRE
jgi:hypothetical protein